jgi:hypothetical protein
MLYVCLSVLDGIEKREKMFLEISALDFLLVQDASVSFTTAFIQAYCELCSFSFFVGLPSHFPGFLRVFNVFSAFRAVRHFVIPRFMLSYECT